jgi:glucose/arabinose dehydrogenase
VARRGAGLLAALVAAAALLLGTAVALPGSDRVVDAAGSYADPRFREAPVWTGLVRPIQVRFAADGRAFVALKDGRVVAFDSIADATATDVLDLRTEVHDFWDRGLLGMILDPDFLAPGPAARPYLYVYYVHDAPPGGTAPVWNDACPASPNGPGATLDGCVVTARLARFTVDRGSNVAIPGSRVDLLHDWCAQFPSHSGGAMAFGSDGMLYVAGGDGASFTVRDYGQRGGTVPNPTAPYTPINPCGDPLTVTSAPGATPTVDVASSEAGALRSQDVRTPGDPTGLAGSLIRIDPDTGEAAPGNPLLHSSDANARRVVAHGFRNPFRLAVRPGTDELYIGDVGDNRWEEIERFVPGSGPATPTTLPNYGWPCYEAGAPTTGWPALGVDLCDDLYAAGPGAVSDALYAYDHTGTAAPCGTTTLRTASITGLAFYEAGAADLTPFPARYDGALFFVDYSRDCLAVLLAGPDGVPDPATMEVVATGIGNPVDLVAGPHGDLYYPDLDRGVVNRIRYAVAPVAAGTVTPAVSAAPVTVTLDASGSRDPDALGQLVAWRWDLDHDGVFDEPVDRSGMVVEWSVTEPGIYPITLQVESSTGLRDSVELVVDASNRPPVPSIDLPGSGLTWSVGDTIPFAGSATDADEGTLAPARLDWSVGILHCGPSDCHEHTIRTVEGAASGTVEGPDHPYPSRLVLRLSATDGHGTVRTTSLELEPETADLRVGSDPPGAPIGIGSDAAAAPVTRTAIRGGTLSVTAPETWSDGGGTYRFVGWADGVTRRSRDVVVSDDTSLTATFVGDAPDTCEAAVAIPGDTWVAQATSDAEDEDWFAFTLGGPREAIVTLGNLPLDARLELYGACDAPLAASDAGGTRFEELVRSLPAGPYRVRVHVPSGASAAAPWVLRVTTSGPRVLVKSVRATRSAGRVRLQGEVVNLTGAVTGRATITAKLRDGSGRVIARLTGTTFAPTLQPGAVTPFLIRGRAPAFASVTWKVTPGTPVADRRLALRGVTSTTNRDGSVRFDGRVRNVDTRVAPDVAIAMTWYGRRGQVVAVRMTATDPSRLAPGKRGTWTLVRPALGGVQASSTALRAR